MSEISPITHRPSREKVIAPTRTEIRFEADEKLYTKLQKLKGFFAHKLKGSNDFADLLEILVDQAIEKEVPRKLKQSVPALEVNTSRSISSRYIPAPISRDAWHNADGRCCYINAETGQRCNSQYALEFDHILPLALGGRTETGNIRILCRTHNQLAAIKKLGLKKMDRYLNHL